MCGVKPDTRTRRLSFLSLPQAPDPGMGTAPEPRDEDLWTGELGELAQ